MNTTTTMKTYRVKVPVCGPIMGMSDEVTVRAKTATEAIRKAVRAVRRAGLHPVHHAENKSKIILTERGET